MMKVIENKLSNTKKATHIKFDEQPKKITETQSKE